jgi:hypothetical protein
MAWSPLWDGPAGVVCSVAWSSRTLCAVASGSHPPAGGFDPGRGGERRPGRPGLGSGCRLTLAAAGPDRPLRPTRLGAFDRVLGSRFEACERADDAQRLHLPRTPLASAPPPRTSRRFAQTRDGRGRLACGIGEAGLQRAHGDLGEHKALKNACPRIRNVVASRFRRRSTLWTGSRRARSGTACASRSRVRMRGEPSRVLCDEGGQILGSADLDDARRFRDRKEPDPRSGRRAEFLSPPGEPAADER